MSNVLKTYLRLFISYKLTFIALQKFDPIDGKFRIHAAIAVIFYNLKVTTLNSSTCRLKKKIPDPIKVVFKRKVAYHLKNIFLFHQTKQPKKLKYRIKSSAIAEIKPASEQTIVHADLLQQWPETSRQNASAKWKLKRIWLQLAVTIHLD